jgi:hypothetical protein
MNSFHGDALMAIDPIKAERLEHRLTASNSTTNLQMGGTTPPEPRLTTTPNITIDEEEASDQEEVHPSQLSTVMVFN